MFDAFKAKVVSINYDNGCLDIDVAGQIMSVEIELEEICKFTGKECYCGETDIANIVFIDGIPEDEYLWTEEDLLKAFINKIYELFEIWQDQVN